jgi:hypothetical protein
MRRRIVITAALALFLTGGACLPWAAAQETAKEGEAQIKPMDSYEVEFTVNELDNGKKINSRSYSMQMPINPLRNRVPPWTEWKRLRVGSQVPIAAGENKFDYKNVGMNIDCRIMLMENGKVALSTNWDYSSLAGGQGHDMPNPVIRHVSSEVEAVVPLDKPTIISQVDDVASTHRYVFEVKVTKITP